MAAVNIKLSARYVRTNPNLEEFRVAHIDGSVSKLHAGLIRAELLILDDFGIPPIPKQTKEDLPEILEGRINQGGNHGDRATRSVRMAWLP